MVYRFCKKTVKTFWNTGLTGKGRVKMYFTERIGVDDIDLEIKWSDTPLKP